MIIQTRWYQPYQMMSFKVALLLLCLLSIATSQESMATIRGSGSSAPCVGLVMDLIQDRSQVPTRLTYREIDNATAAQAEFVTSIANGSIDFGAGHHPLDSVTYQTLTQQGVAVLQFPHILSPVGLYHNIPGIGKLNLTSCLIAKIFTRRIKSWKNRYIVEQNPSLKDLESHEITVIRSNSVSGVTRGFTEVRFVCAF
jgi:ABC-type phosphate transport system substrate-binding protein